MSQASSNVSGSFDSYIQPSQTSQTDGSLQSHSRTRDGATCEPNDGVENLEDYETQLFGFTPKSFISGIYNAVGEYFMEALNAMEEYISEGYSDVMTKEEISEKMTNIRRHIVTQIDKAFDTLEAYLATNIFRIPPGVVLPEDQIQIDCPVSREEYDKVEQETVLAKKRILAVKLSNAILKRRLQDMMHMQETFDKVLQRLQAARSEVTKAGVCDISDSVRHCSSKILGCISALQELKDGGLDPNSEYLNTLITFLEEKSEPKKRKVSGSESE